MKILLFEVISILIKVLCYVLKAILRISPKIKYQPNILQKQMNKYPCKRITPSIHRE